MAISGKQFSSYATQLRALIVGKHISRPTLVARDTLYFRLSGKEDHRFVISLDKGFPRCYLAPLDSGLSNIDSPIYAVFRKELANAYIEEVSRENDDRILRFDLLTTNAVYKEERKHLYFEMFVAHPNLVLTDESGNIIAYSHGTSLDVSRPIVKGIKYSLPEKKAFLNEDEPFDYASFREECLLKESQILDSRKKERFGHLLSQFETKEKRLNRKIALLEQDEIEAKKHLLDAKYGDYIYTNFDDIDINKPLQVDGELIPLDKKKSLAENANCFYKKAKKAKKALSEKERLKKEIADELADTQNAIALLKESDEEDLESFAKEWKLIGKNGKEPEIGGANMPYFVKVGSTHILFGKNAKQNDTLTFLLDTSKTHYWFHVNLTRGAHVMIKKEHPSEEEILIASEIALISASLKDGDVMKTLRKNVYKGNVPGQAIVREYETIHLKKVRESTINLYKEAKKISLRKEP